jgi:hypothetical protein
MQNFFRRLHAAWLYWRTFPVVVLPDGYWSDADAKALSNFLGTDAGAKFRHLRWNAVYQSQLQAITNRHDSAYAAGTAFGMRSMVAFEDSLLAISLPTSGSSESTTLGISGFQSVNR